MRRQIYRVFAIFHAVLRYPTWSDKASRTKSWSQIWTIYQETLKLMAACGSKFPSIPSFWPADFTQRLESSSHCPFAVPQHRCFQGTGGRRAKGAATPAVSARCREICGGSGKSETVSAARCERLRLFLQIGHISYIHIDIKYHISYISYTYVSSLPLATHCHCGPGCWCHPPGPLVSKRNDMSMRWPYHLVSLRFSLSQVSRDKMEGHPLSMYIVYDVQCMTYKRDTMYNIYIYIV